MATELNGNNVIRFSLLYGSGGSTQHQKAKAVGVGVDKAVNDPGDQVQLSCPLALGKGMSSSCNIESGNAGVQKSLEQTAQDPSEPTDPNPPSPPPKVLVSVYSQDPFVADPIVVDFPQDKIGDHLSGPRVHTVDPGRTLATPDAQGNYIMEPGTDQISQVNAHVVTYNTLDVMQKYRGGKVDWAFGDEAITVIPHKQEGRNAYYSRWEGGTNFFWFPSEALHTTVVTSNAEDVVSHETGHAILDGVRPGYFGGWDPETGAFHEAFGDCVAMLMNLQDPRNRALIMQQTGGDLRRVNALSSLAEEFGAAIRRDNDDPTDDNKTYLRNAINDFTYLPPEQLPPGRGDETHLGREVHSFSRLFSGAFYDVLEGIFKQAVYKERRCPEDALKRAADVAGPLLMRAIDMSSSQRARWREIALNMIAADRDLNGGQYGDVLREVFLKRRIISPEDLAQEEARRKNIPSLVIPEPFVNGKQVEDFIGKHRKELGLPEGLPVQATGVFTDDKGEQFVTAQYTKEVPVTGVEGFEGYTTDVHGGVTLVFNADGTLKDYRHDAITDDVVEAEMAGIAAAKGSNAILESEQAGQVKGGIFKGIAKGKKLIRVPVSSC